ncbi:MAG TPA: DUF2784 domain-containing protein [Propionibacteriaceae bacterium]
MWYRVGADLVVVVHLLIIGFIVGGVFLTWRWQLIIWAHIPAVICGALVEFAGFTCPLTLLENDLRQRAGEAGYRDGFIAHYLVKVIYPPGLLGSDHGHVPEDGDGTIDSYRPGKSASKRNGAAAYRT